jgi:hypothetical protein
MPAFRTFGSATLYGGRTARASKSSTIGYVKGKTTFWTTNHALLVRTHPKPLYPNKRISETLKTFPEIFKTVKEKINSGNNQLS